MGKYYLKPNTVFEPLFNRWYAWSHLVSPTTAAMNTLNHHIKLMLSYLEAPEVHHKAAKNPELKGGPFLDFETDQSEKIKLFIKETLVNCKNIIAFAKAVHQLDAILRDSVNKRLEDLYSYIPDLLKGLVDLVYDINEKPSIRFNEGLIFKSEYFRKDLQSFVLTTIDADKRPFVLSTPRFEFDGSVHVEIPFENEALDQLFKMRFEPDGYLKFKDVFNLDGEKWELFKTFFTSEAPKTAYNKYTKDGVRIRYYGHACSLIETDRVSILVDPVISYDYENGIDRFSFKHLPETIDYVLITHNHMDHLVLETLLQLRHRIKQIIVPRSAGGNLEDPSMKTLLKHIGFQHVFEAFDMELFEIPDGSIRVLPFLGEHGDLNIKSKGAHLVELKGQKILLAADSTNLEPKLYQHLYHSVGNVDIIFIGMECVGAPLTWLYGPLLTQGISRENDQSRRFDGSNYEQAIEIVKVFECTQVYIYAMGQEPWLNYFMATNYEPNSPQIVNSDQLIEDCTSRGIYAERLFGKKEMFLDAKHSERLQEV